MGYFALAEASWLAAAIYLLYILFAQFCVMNVIIGIFCHNAMEAFETDKEKVVEARLKAKKTYVDSLVDLFHEFDEDGSNQISKQEFEQGLGQPRMQAVLKTLDIEKRDATALFDMLADASGDVNLEDFVTGCINLRGTANAIQVES